MIPERRIYLPKTDDEKACVPAVRFRLTYEGELRSNQKDEDNGYVPLAKHKHSIRRGFHRQLKSLWETNKFLNEHEVYPTDYVTGRSPDTDASKRDGLGVTDRLRLVNAIADQYVENGYRFVPLVRESTFLLCGLDVLFLRRDFPGGGVISAGDIDNRVKTLIDALRKPKSAAELSGIQPGQDENPFFCLLEDDSQVSSLSVEADRLLAPPSGKESQASQVRIVVTVTLRPYHVTMFNLGFAGD